MYNGSIYFEEDVEDIDVNNDEDDMDVVSNVEEDSVDVVSNVVDEVKVTLEEDMKDKSDEHRYKRRRQRAYIPVINFSSQRQYLWPTATRPYNIIISQPQPPNSRTSSSSRSTAVAANPTEPDPAADCNARLCCAC